MPNFRREQIAIDNISLDAENPRFSSHFARTGQSKPDQDKIMLYLLENANIGSLAASIQTAGGLHPAESIVCLKENNKYIVLEGNRRVCACKALKKTFDEGRNWLPSTVKPSFPFLESTKSSDIDMLNSIDTLDTIVYDNRSFAQAYISDKHIDGVKKWNAVEKESYFYTLYLNEKQNNPEATGNDIITTISKITVSKKAVVKESVIKYNFFIEVFNIVKSTFPNQNIEMNSYLPMVDRFMGVLVGNDPDVGLDLILDDDFKYIALPEKENIYKEILQLVGEAFLVRKKQDDCIEGELCRISADELKGGVAKQKNLIMENIRIPGLFLAIQRYKVGQQSTDENEANPEDESEDFSSDNTSENSTGTEGDTQSADSAQDESPSTGNEQSGMSYDPEVPWKPRQMQHRSLTFTVAEGAIFNLQDNDDEDAKIKFIIKELSKLYISTYPYSCTLLYRTLLEAATRKAFAEKQPRANGKTLQYNEKQLASEINKLVNSGALNKLTDAMRGAIKTNISQQNLISTLNNYVHNPKLVDTNLILSSWITMKEYIVACLT